MKYNGMALYVRRITRSKHGTPEEFARRMHDAGLKWIALAGIWQYPDKRQVALNSAATIAAYGKALEARGIRVWVWGYPWIDKEAEFVRGMLGCAQGLPAVRILLDPELGANPSKQSGGNEKRRANRRAKELVERFRDSESVEELGLSTYGSGWRLGWFPLLAYTKALGACFKGRTFIGGQTYTDVGAIAGSIADMGTAIRRAGFEVGRDIDVIPNFGLYARHPTTRKVRKKTPAELDAHLVEFMWAFMGAATPIRGLIGWAENFATPQLLDRLAKHADIMGREG